MVQNPASMGAPRRFAAPLNFRLAWLCLLVAFLVGFSGCFMAKRGASVAGTQTRTFVSQNFFSIDYPGDWVTRDLDDGANLFFADELIFVRVKILEPPDPRAIDQFMEEKIKADAEVQGGQASVVRKGTKGVHPYSVYLITKPNGQRMQEILLYNDELRLLYVLFGSSRSEDFDEFGQIFATMFESFQFRITARLPSATGTFDPDFSTLSSTWVAFLEGLRTEDYDLLQKACAPINASKIINDAEVRKVKGDYFPYATPLFTFVSHVEQRDRLAIVKIALRALPPEGFLKHETREFILEENRWRLLRFERTE